MDNGDHQPDGVTAEFSIQGALCQVIPEDRVSDPLMSGREHMFDMRAKAQVIGSCLLDGQYYLILCSRTADQGAPKSYTSAVEVLTRRELQVALMVCEGHGNKRIAHRLGLSEWTVSTYLRRIYVKLGVHTRAAMAARLISSVKPQPPGDEIAAGQGHQVLTKELKI